MTVKGGIPWNKGLKAKDHSNLRRSLDAAHNALRGKPSWNRGKPLSSETKKKLSLIASKRVFTDEYKRKLSLSHMGHKVSKEHREKISKIMKGRKITWRDKISKGRIGKYTGVNCPAWKGGLSFFPYPIDWTETLRRSIRERDNYTCQLCGKLQGDIAHDVHHIDYDKKNCNPTNLITLCHKCHAKTNNKRKYWLNLFSTLKV